MTPDDWYIQKSLEYSKEDAEIFKRATSHLPKRRNTTPYHSGPHSVKNFRAAMAISEAKFIMEIGFCLGHSASTFLDLGAAFVVSIDNSHRDETVEAVVGMRSKYDSKFRFIWRDEINNEKPLHPCLAYIDGDHSLSSIVEDTKLCIKHNALWILYDDYWPHWGDTQEAMKQLNLYPLAIIGTTALVKL